MRRRVSDHVFLLILVLLLFIGSFIFISASLGLLARGGVEFSGLAIKHFIGLALGIIALLGASNIPYRFWKKYSFYIFIATCVLTALVLVPGLGFEHGGARRWLLIGGVSIQPAEFLKFGFIFYFAALLSSLGRQLHTVKNGLIPVMLVIAVPAMLLIAQPDTGTLLVIGASAFSMYLAAGARWKHIGLLFLAALIGVVILVSAKPYIYDRLMTFMDPSRDALGSGYQIQQSLIAIGSGGTFGRGFGQSIQKFSYLPEPIGDSIFAVAAEEFGFVGSIIIISLFIAFAYRGLHIAARAPNHFSGLLVIGIVILVVVQSFINIASMLGVFPLTGMPLLFFSHGGTALLVTMFGMGIVLNVSKYKRKKVS